MVEPLPRWVQALFAGLGLAIVAAGVWWFALDGRLGDREPASWRVDPAAELHADSRSIPILVNERACASGQPASGRISTSVAYTDDAVHLRVWVRPFGGDQSCPSNPDTPHVVVLEQPLGDRAVRGGDWPDP